MFQDSLQKTSVWFDSVLPASPKRDRFELQFSVYDPDCGVRRIPTLLEALDFAILVSIQINGVHLTNMSGSPGPLHFR